MGPFPIAVLSGCLSGLRWLFWAVSALLVLLVAIQAMRGDADALPQQNLVVAFGFCAAGWAAGFAARKLVE